MVVGATLIGTDPEQFGRASARARALLTGCGNRPARSRRRVWGLRYRMG